MKKMISGKLLLVDQTLMLLTVALTLTACGVQDESLSGNAESNAALIVPAASTSGTGSVQGREDDAVVSLRFSDSPFTGYWRADPEFANSAPTTQVFRVTFGSKWFHMDFFDDKSGDSGTDGLNCYRSIQNDLRLVPNGLGLRPIHEVDRTTDYWEFTIVDNKLQRVVIDEEGNIADRFGLTTSSRIFEGLSAADLPICDEG